MVDGCIYIALLPREIYKGFATHLHTLSHTSGCSLLCRVLVRSRGAIWAPVCYQRTRQEELGTQPLTLGLGTVQPVVAHELWISSYHKIKKNFDWAFSKNKQTTHVKKKKLNQYLLKQSNIICHLQASQVENVLWSLSIPGLSLNTF